MAMSAENKKLWRLRTARKFLSNVLEDMSPDDNTMDKIIVLKCIEDLQSIIKERRDDKK